MADGTDDDAQFREVLQVEIRDGLREGRWGWFNTAKAPPYWRIALDLFELDDANDLRQDQVSLVRESIREAEKAGFWPKGWALETMKQNARRRAYKRGMARGELSGKAKLTATDVAAIRKRWAGRKKSGVTQVQLAAEYQVSRMQIHRIIKGEQRKEN